MSQMTLTNYESGDVLITNGSGTSIRLAREFANRLILYARMHGIDDFYQHLPELISHPELVQSIRSLFDQAKTASERWNLKEKFARLSTLAKSYVSKNPGEVMEVVCL
ncbi:MAG: hypothetical protein HYT76_02355 [Deltaproteobacteria bacterium]|nr:hypothetical protein [Deltaproteobacteria bacterium]